MGTADQDLPRDREDNTVGRRDVLRAAAVTGIATLGALVHASPAGAVIWEEGEQQCHASTSEKDPNYDVDDALLANFMQISRTLTGMPLSSPSDTRLGRAYLDRFSRIDVPKVDLRKLLSAGKETAEAIMNTEEMRPAAEQLIYLWYLSAFFLPPKDKPADPPVWIYGSTDQYESGLLWTVIGAHAPMMPMRGAKAKEHYWASKG